MKNNTEKLEQKKDFNKNNESQAYILQDLIFYFKSSLYLLMLLIIFEMLVMFVISKVSISNEHIVPWVFRMFVFSYFFWKIHKRFRGLNFLLFGAILGFETGIVMAVVKIIIHKGAQWTWFNLITEPVYLAVFTVGVALIFSFGNKKIK